MYDRFEYMLLICYEYSNLPILVISSSMSDWIWSATVPFLCPRALTAISCVVPSGKTNFQSCEIPYSGKFSHGAKFRAFRAQADFAKIRTAKF